ncbi:MAG: hypothetical protein IJ737_02170 [Ruminococcus sp.]|nr:hypothetical protein [Ruminococcus sp.]
MICSKCGKKLEAGTAVCPVCKSPVKQLQATPVKIEETPRPSVYTGSVDRETSVQGVFPQQTPVQPAEQFVQQPVQPVIPQAQQFQQPVQPVIPSGQPYQQYGQPYPQQGYQPVQQAPVQQMQPMQPMQQGYQQYQPMGQPPYQQQFYPEPAYAGGYDEEYDDDERGGMPGVVKVIAVLTVIAAIAAIAVYFIFFNTPKGKLIGKWHMVSQTDIETGEVRKMTSNEYIIEFKRGGKAILTRTDGTKDIEFVLNGSTLVLSWDDEEGITEREEFNVDKLTGTELTLNDGKIKYVFEKQN